MLLGLFGIMLLGLFGLSDILGKSEDTIIRETEARLKDKYDYEKNKEKEKAKHKQKDNKKKQIRENLLEIVVPCRICGNTDKVILSKKQPMIELRSYSGRLPAECVCCNICGHVDFFFSGILHNYQSNKTEITELIQSGYRLEKDSNKEND